MDSHETTDPEPARRRAGRHAPVRLHAECRPARRARPVAGGEGRGLGAGAPLAGRLQLRAQHGDQPAGDVAGRHVRPRHHRPRAGLGRGPRASTASASSSTTCSGSRTARASSSGWTSSSAIGRPAQDRRDVRPVRQRLGPVPPGSGKQRAPQPGLHNSGWVQSPGLEILKDPDRHDELEGYVKGVVGRFRDDRRVHAWDLFNEPDNTNGSSYGKLEPANKPELALALLKKAFAWAREADPIAAADHRRLGRRLGRPGRLIADRTGSSSSSRTSSASTTTTPLPEMKARRREPPSGTAARSSAPSTWPAPPAARSTRSSAYFKRRTSAAYNWGFVAGKTQTIYPWDSWKKPYTAEPPVWFHDIFRPDGTPYDSQGGRVHPRGDGGEKGGRTMRSCSPTLARCSICTSQSMEKLGIPRPGPRYPLVLEPLGSGPRLTTDNARLA